MGSVNKVILLGNLGADPEVRTTASGQVVATLRVATSSAYVDKGGERRETTEWHSVVVWGKPAEFAQRYLAKGRKVYVEGRLQTRKWTDKEGRERYTTEVVASDLQGIDKPPTQQDSRPAPMPARPPKLEAQDDIYGDADVPF